MPLLPLDAETVAGSHTVKRAAVNSQDGGGFLFVPASLLSYLLKVELLQLGKADTLGKWADTNLRGLNLEPARQVFGQNDIRAGEPVICRDSKGIFESFSDRPVSYASCS